LLELTATNKPSWCLHLIGCLSPDLLAGIFISLTLNQHVLRSEGFVEHLVIRVWLYLETALFEVCLETGDDAGDAFLVFLLGLLLLQVLSAHLHNLVYEKLPKEHHHHRN
jgi:hypothetical protein